MSIAAVNSGVNFKGVKNTFKRADVPEIDPCFKYLFGNAPKDEPTILKAGCKLNLFA